MQPAHDRESGLERAGEVLPEYWPADRAVAAVRPYWLPWPVAIVLVPLFWLMPRRMGPHFAAVRWPGAVVAQVFWTLYGAGCIGLAFMNAEVGWPAWLLARLGLREPVLVTPPDLSEVFRSPLALLATYGLAEPATTGFETYLAVVAGLVVVQLALPLPALALLAFVVGLARRRDLLARSVKLAAWTWTSLVVLGLVFQAIELIEAERYTRNVLWSIAYPLYLGWWLWIWLRATSRSPDAMPCVSASEVPVQTSANEPQARARAFPNEPQARARGSAAALPPRRRPCCEGCGYLLTGLRAEDRCPECGRRVADSLPEQRRPSPLLEGRGIRGRLRAYGRTAWAVMTRRTFYQELAVHQRLERARSFALSACVMGGCLAAVVAWLAFVLRVEQRPMGQPVVLLEHAAILAWVAVVTSGLMIFSLGMLGLRAMLLPGGDGDSRPLQIRARAVVLLHHGVWMMPAGLIVGVSLGLGLWKSPPLKTDTLGRWLELWLCDRVGFFAVPTAAFLVIAIFALLACSLSQAWKQTRFANA